MAQTVTPGPGTKVINGLDTYNYTVINSGLHTVSLGINEIPPSGITITIKKNGSTIASTSAPAASQQVINLSALINCTASDVLGVVVASASAIDSGLNDFKGILNIRQGIV
jgi:hypothetical protein